MGAPQRTSNASAGARKPSPSTLSYIEGKVKGAISYVFSPLKEGVETIVLFIKNNWKQIIAFVLAWAVIIAGMGLMYGFSNVAWPLATGLGFGMGFGIIMGIVVAKCVKPSEEWKNKCTLWALINSGFNMLDPNGTRMLVLSVAITVVLAASVVFPTSCGVILGFIVGNHLATTIALRGNLGNGGDKVNQARMDVSAAQQQLAILQGQFNALAQQIQALQQPQA